MKPNYALYVYYGGNGLFRTHFWQTSAYGAALESYGILRNIEEQQDGIKLAELLNSRGEQVIIWEYESISKEWCMIIPE